MGRPIDPLLRYMSNKRCSVDGTYERYRQSNHCCKCRERENERYQGMPQKSQAGRNRKPEIVERAIPLRDPTQGAAFPAPLSRLMAGH
jgi:hypothetical protein